MKNLPENVSSERLKKLFEKNGNVTKVVLLPTKFGQGRLDVCFIHFAERSSALKAVKSTGNYEIDGNYLLIYVSMPYNMFSLNCFLIDYFKKQDTRYLCVLIFILADLQLNLAYVNSKGMFWRSPLLDIGQSRRTMMP